MSKCSLLLFVFFIYTKAFPQTASKTDYAADLDYLKSTLVQKHPNLFLKVSETDFDKRIADIKQKMADHPDSTWFATALMRLFVLIGDEHTRLEQKYTQYFPIQFEHYSDGVFAIATDSSNRSILPAKLIAINGHPMDTLIAKLKEVVQHENESYFKVGMLSSLNNPVVLQQLGFVNEDGKANFTLFTKNKDTVRLPLTAVEKLNLETIPLVRNDPKRDKGQKDHFYWYQYDKPNKVFYFNYSKCAEEKGRPFESFNTDLFAQIAQEKPNKIILDLRSNGGGNSAVLAPFMERMRTSYLNKKGRFFVLIGKRTFSSALMNAVYLKQDFNVILVGEPTSGSINHFGEVRGTTLPYSKLPVAYSTKYWETWKGKEGPLRPDIPISYASVNFQNGTDEAIASILRK